MAARLRRTKRLILWETPVVAPPRAKYQVMAISVHLGTIACSKAAGSGLSAP